MILPAAMPSIKLNPSASIRDELNMARYKHIDSSPRLVVDLSQQLLPGTFEHALNYLLDHELDLSGLDARFCNDEVGAPAYPPAMLLKLILFAYSRGIVISRGIERACLEHVTFMALVGNDVPHFTPVTGFIRSLCDQQGLIGRRISPLMGSGCQAMPARLRVAPAVSL